MQYKGCNDLFGGIWPYFWSLLVFLLGPWQCYIFVGFPDPLWGLFWLSVTRTLLEMGAVQTVGSDGPSLPANVFSLSPGQRRSRMQHGTGSRESRRLCVPAARHPLPFAPQLQTIKKKTKTKQDPRLQHADSVYNEQTASTCCRQCPQTADPPPHPTPPQPRLLPDSRANPGTMFQPEQGLGRRAVHIPATALSSASLRASHGPPRWCPQKIDGCWARLTGCC